MVHLRQRSRSLVALLTILELSIVGCAFYVATSSSRPSSLVGHTFQYYTSSTTASGPSSEWAGALSAVPHPDQDTLGSGPLVSPGDESDLSAAPHPNQDTLESPAAGPLATPPGDNTMEVLTNITRTDVAHESHSRSWRVAERRKRSAELSRRQYLRTGTIILGAVVVGGATAKHSFFDSPKGRIAPVNFTQVAQQTTINVTMECTTTCVSLDRTTFQKKRTLNLPSWFPPALVPPPKVIKDISNSELLTAAIVSGSIVEMARTTVLYPLLTLKTRIQTDINRRHRFRRRRLHIKRRLQVLRLNVVRHYQEGRLFAGLVPSLIVSVPATGVYYGVRDVVRRMLIPLSLDDIPVSVMAAFVADIVSLMIRTPTDTLAIRLQVATGEEGSNNTDSSDDDVDGDSEAIIESKVGNWFDESLERLPAVILTDLPYLLSRIALNRALIHGDIDIGHYELTAIATALLCAMLTTPFDVARTRILVDSDDDPTTGIDGGSGEGLLRTFRTIYNEGDGRLSNLFAGWFERTLYLGIGRACLEPIQIVGYMAIRDAILLEWFD